MATEEIKLQVEGMSCTHCVKSVTDAVSKLKGVQKVDVDLDSGTVTSQVQPGSVSREQIAEEIEDQGYDVVG